MIVKARAVILIDGRLIVANQRRRGLRRTASRPSTASGQPPILEQIARGLASGWRDTPRWLGNIEHLLRSHRIWYAVYAS